MNFCVVICLVACAISGASSASVRLRRQVWREQFPDHFHFPDQTFQMDPDDFNQVIDFPNAGNRPNSNQNNGFRPPANNRPNSNQNGFRPPANNRPNSNQNGFRPPVNNRPNSNQNGARPTRPTTTTTTTPSSTAAWSSTPRTYHLAPEGCNCPFTPQFNPVCGSDGNTYKNSGLLKCFRRCGIDVSQRRMGAC